MSQLGGEIPIVMVLVALGANLAGPGGRSPVETCRWAVGRLAAWPGMTLRSCSRWYRTAPVPPSGQADFVNGVARFEAAAAPEAMLAALHAVEDEAGRTRSAPNAARTLDLDLLAMDGLLVDRPGLILPHPRLHERAFVLAPMQEVAPEWVHPRLGLGPGALLLQAGRAGIALLPCLRDGDPATPNLAGPPRST